MEAIQHQAAPGAHVSSLPASIEDKIADELGRSGISGYELSCRYGVSKHLVDKIGRAHMGGALYGERDKRATERLFDKVRAGVADGLSSDQLASELRISKGTAYRMARTVSEIPGGGMVEMISMRHASEGARRQAAAAPAPAQAQAPAAPEPAPGLPAPRPAAAAPAAAPGPGAQGGAPAARRRGRPAKGPRVMMRARGVQVEFDPCEPGAAELAMAIISYASGAEA